MRNGTLKMLAIGLAAMGMSACTPVVENSAADSSGPGLVGFASKDDLDRFAGKMAKRQRARAAMYESSVAAPMAMEAAADSADASAEGESESITNTQEAGVDEGGIVKNAGDYLVVLRRGRLFTVRHGDDALAPVDTIDAFPPGKPNPGDTWYDEMLVSGDQVIVIGYSYGEFGTELNRFDLSGSGELTYRDTHYLRSGDYYSSSNYASRLIGDELILYAPVYARWDDLDATMPALRGFGERAETKTLVRPEDFLIAEPYRTGEFELDMLHVVTRCDLSAPELDCSARAIAGTWSRAFYVSRGAVYVWTGSAQTSWDDDAERTPGQLYRIPLDGAQPGAVQVAGSPIDQFSFAENAEDGVLRVLLRELGNGEGMWASEFSGGDVALANVPLAGFDNGAAALPQSDYRPLPAPEGWRFHNRFVGDYLLYAAGDYGSEDATATVYAVPLDGSAVQEVSLRHGITRFDRLGDDGVAIGPSRGGALGFSSLSLGSRARVEDTYMLPAANEGETRSQAFFFRPDSGSDGLSGTLGLPVTRRLARDGAEFLGSGSSIAFLRRDARRLSPVGELVARTQDASDDNCVASCVDWYGNARPIFMGERIFALMGYEMVEGRLAGGSIRETRRISFAP
ncbi:beta-propeller domain-containing protein [Erythrobacter sp. JK5]|uniref:beta-propeller domain-containing protein n=1 Tax=Erythrobacter sp. JK5 TaxID=2829500 RepID=UPI001BABFDE0|nr:beta-propeller domain-containing protein [Erythrobacter sp. JK5]QUL38521.1 beta-propeller domain-containing protein [Erythrobacter sp. JK5]